MPAWSRAVAHVCFFKGGVEIAGDVRVRSLCTPYWLHATRCTCSQMPTEPCLSSSHSLHMRGFFQLLSRTACVREATQCFCGCRQHDDAEILNLHQSEEQPSIFHTLYPYVYVISMSGMMAAIMPE